MTEQRDRADNAEDLGILYPDADLEIQGETITVRELRFLEGLRLHADLQPFLRRLTALLRSDEDISVALLERAFSEHAELLQSLLAMTTGKRAEWVASLDDEHGYRLALAFWQVNRGFFLRRVVADVLTADLARQTPEPALSAGARSSAH